MSAGFPVRELVATEVAWSSIVGKSVLLSSPLGPAYAQVSIMVHADVDRKEAAETIAAEIVKIWNDRR